MKKPAESSKTNPALNIDLKKLTTLAQQKDAFQISDDSLDNASEQVHSFGKHQTCTTGSRGFATPIPVGTVGSVIKIRLNVEEGFIPLWAANTNLYWRFQERSFARFKNPEAAKDEVRKLLAGAVSDWGEAAPVKFKEVRDNWDFEVVMNAAEDCDASGCVLASAFFPDAGRHELTLYPTLFNQPLNEQVDTLCHEIGHVFGLRHFFADVSEQGFPSVVFGKNDKFSIMNYGELSTLTQADRNDLARLYEQARSGALTAINGTPIRFVQPYHTLFIAPESPFALKDAMAFAQLKYLQQLTNPNQ